MTPRRLMLVLGSAVILAANAVALTGVVYNRSGEPESRVALSERELVRSWGGPRRAENSGLALSLAWRVAFDDDGPNAFYYVSNGGRPAWLDEKRLAQMGIDVEAARRGNANRSTNVDATERQVLVVLELAGEAWQQAVAKARRRLAHQEALLKENPDAKQRADAEKRAREYLSLELEKNSRLFAIDVGTDLSQLRARYPDRSRYMILRCDLRLQRTVRDKQRVVIGHLGNLYARQMNVPHPLRDIFDDDRDVPGPRAEARPRFTATVAVGRRLEPWIETMTPR